MRWSKLRVLLLDLFDPAVALDIHCTAMRGDGNAIGKYWVVLSGETIWEAPQNAAGQLRAGAVNDTASRITALLREYLDTPKERLLSDELFADRYGIVDLLRAADRRIGKERLRKFFGEDPPEPIKRILSLRGIRFH